jgi:hypothetical protein
MPTHSGVEEDYHHHREFKNCYLELELEREDGNKTTFLEKKIRNFLECDRSSLRLTPLHVI